MYVYHCVANPHTRAHPTARSQLLEHRVEHLRRLARPAQVRGESLALADDLVDRPVDPQRRRGVPEVAEHERGGPDGRERVRDALARDVGR